MKTHEYQSDCQISGLKNLVEGPQESPYINLKLLIRRYLGPARVRVLERNINNLINWYAKIRGKDINLPTSAKLNSTNPLKAGDWVRIRNLEEIEKTLDHFKRLKGCGFATEMSQFCGSTQRVLKPVERFVDERELRVVRTKGVVILEDLTCQGMGSFGRCDRNCYYFWRVEWLEKIDLQSVETTG